MKTTFQPNNGQTIKEAKMKTWTLTAFDKDCRKLAIFSPTFKGSFKDALEWFSKRDIIYNNPNIVSIIIKEV